MLTGKAAADFCHLGVDLTLLYPNGINGGIKPAILTFLQRLRNDHGDHYRFTLLSNTSTHDELIPLVRAQDQLFCVRAMRGKSFQQIAQPAANVRFLRHFSGSTLRELGVEVLYCPFGPTFYAAPGIPTVALVVDLLHRDFPYSISRAERSWRERYFNRLISEADFVQTISEYGAKRLLEHYAFDPSRVFRTYLPIDQHSPPPVPPPKGVPYFIYPANFWLHKNHELALLAYRIYRQTTVRPAWDLVLTGQPDQRSQALEKLAKSLQIDRYVRFSGHLLPERFSSVFAGAGALFYPSLHEGFGIPLVEAMQFGKPIVCGNTASQPEIARNAALLVNPRDAEDMAAALRQVTEDDALRNGLVLAAQGRLTDFSLEREVNKLSETLLRAKQEAGRCHASRGVGLRLRSRFFDAFHLRLFADRCREWVRKLMEPNNDPSVAVPANLPLGFDWRDLRGVIRCPDRSRLKPDLTAWAAFLAVLDREGNGQFRWGYRSLGNRWICSEQLDLRAVGSRGRFTRDALVRVGGWDQRDLLFFAASQGVPRTRVHAVALIDDLSFWTTPGEVPEATRLVLQANLVDVITRGYPLLFLTEELHRSFESLLPDWLADTARPYQVFRWHEIDPKEGEPHSKNRMFTAGKMNASSNFVRLLRSFASLRKIVAPLTIQYSRADSPRRPHP